MRWPWWRWSWKHADVDPEEAKRALAAARRERTKVEAQQPRVDSVSDALARHYTENHVSEMLEQAMRRRRG